VLPWPVSRPAAVKQLALSGRLRRSFVIPLVLLAAALTVPATAAATGGISGNVADLDGHGVPDVCARAFSTTNFNPGGAPAATATTDQNGAYLIAGLDIGDYNVQFSDDSALCPGAGDFYLVQWYDATSDPNAATPVSVADASVAPDVDAALLEPQAIVGHVQNLDGQALANICVVVNDAVALDVSGPPPGFAQTDAGGDYVIFLPTGDYKVQFYDGGFPCNVGKYVAQWYHDKPDVASADVITVAANRTKFGIDAVMREVSRIKGHVQDEVGAPLTDICVVASDATTPNGSGPPPGFARTLASGDYSMDVLPGDYKLRFYDDGTPCNVGKYVGQFYNDKADFGTADVIHVARGATVTGINATLRLFVAPIIVAQPPPIQPAAPPPSAVVKCRVPHLRGVRLRKAKTLLRRAHCRVGTVTRKTSSRRGRVGRVISSKPRAGSVRPAGTRVALVVGRRP
jgi:hypothetical protein